LAYFAEYGAVEICLGTSPSQAKSRLFVNASPLPTIPLEMIGPIPGLAHQAFTVDIPACRNLDLVRQTLGALLEPAPAALVIRFPRYRTNRNSSTFGG
jgi:hypothetical protein